MSSKLIIASSLLIALGTTSCGTANQESETRKRTPNHNIGEHDAKDASSGPQGRATFALTLSPRLKEQAKTVRFQLAKSECGPTPTSPCNAMATVINKDFPATLDKFDFGQIPAGDYAISLQLLDAKKQIIAGGNGKATVAQGKTTQAKVSINVTADKPAGSGNLVITIEEGAVSMPPSEMPPLLACTTEGMLPVCVKSGQGYKVQNFEKNAQCQWVPELKTLQTVDNKFCKGLPGSEGLYTP